MSNLEILRRRKSVRSYSPAAVSDAVRNKLNSEATYINSHESGLSFRTCFDDGAPFKGFGRSYGMFRNVNNYLAVLVDTTFPNTLERAGYFAEQWITEAVKLGLSTCFVGGTFSPGHVATRMEVYEKIPFVVAFGYAEEDKTSMVARIATKMAHREKRSPREFYDGDDAEYAEACRKLPWLETALEAVACAPSALNKRPVRLKFTRHEGVGTVKAFTISSDKYAVELGIAKFNVAFAVGGTWDWGEDGVFYPQE